jgi:hypothetical protein
MSRSITRGFNMKQDESLSNEQMDQLSRLTSKIIENSRERLYREPMGRDLIKRLNADLNELRERLR